MNHTLAFIFPGQGSQSAGMLSSLLAEEAVVRDCVSEASDVLGYDMAALIAENPHDQLHQTEFTQPALLTASIALLRLWQHRQGGAPSCVAGHSLGEYSALVATGSLAFSDAVSFVAFRGRMMTQAVPVGTGKMAAVLGLEQDVMNNICQQSSHEQAQVWLANDNCPGQLVIAGHTAAVELAMTACTAAGARRVLPLAVSVPSHTPLMQPAADAMSERLQSMVLQPLQCPLWSNVDAQPKQQVDDIRAGLLAQLTSPVRWTDCMRNMTASGINTAVEMGPGKVLAGLMRRIDKGCTVYVSDSDAAMQKALHGVTHA
ncbi:MAG: ACP S-malonyltransferase [Mariprofundaceae bacterium]|nr:ACP S-malonyltransferase [Mariprofundaceae bacterium]